MDKIKTVKIKNQDGTVSEESYSISVDATNVDMSNGKDLQDTIGNINIDEDGNVASQLKKIDEKINISDIIDNLNSEQSNKPLSAKQGYELNVGLNKKPYYYNTVADMKIDIQLKAGDMAITLGYYEANDGGAGKYKIVNNSDGYYEELENELKAELIIEDRVTPEQFGAYGDGTHDDTIALQKALDIGKNIYLKNSIYIISNTLIVKNSSNISGVINESKHTSKNLGSIIKINNNLTYGIQFGILCKLKNFTLDCNYHKVDYAIISNQEVTTESNSILERITICNNPQGNGFYIGKTNSLNQGFNNNLIDCVSRICFRGYWITCTDNTLNSCQADACSVGAMIANSQNTLINCMFFNSKISNLNVIYSKYCNIFGGSCDNYSQSSDPIVNSVYIDNSSYINIYGLRVIGGTEAHIKIINSNFISLNELLHEVEEENKPEYFYKAQGANSKLLVYNPKYNMLPSINIGLGVNIIKIENMVKRGVTFNPVNGVTKITENSFIKNNICYVNCRFSVSNQLSAAEIGTMTAINGLSDFIFLSIQSVTSGINLGMARIKPLSGEIQAYLDGASFLTNGDYVITGAYYTES